MGIEVLLKEMGIPALLIAAVIVIVIATGLLNYLFPASRKPPDQPGPP